MTTNPTTVTITVNAAGHLPAELTGRLNAFAADLEGLGIDDVTIELELDDEPGTD